MRKIWKWFKSNKLATTVIVCITWITHYTIETLIVDNILGLIGLTMPVLTL
jgi:hypothetical protein